MRGIFFFLVSATMLFSGEYLTNKSCKECHEEIYNEYQRSWHAKSYHNDILHKKVADAVSDTQYECASCHMPNANTQALATDKTLLAKKTPQQQDAIGCMYCHQIGYVQEHHKQNKIFLAKKPQGYKVAMFGSLQDPDSSDKHEMAHSPIYDKYACSGCHSHKQNSHGVEVFRAMQTVDGSRSCIKCHMPYLLGGVEKTNKKGRTKHRSHRFLGIHSKEMAAKALEFGVKKKDDFLVVSVENKMDHPLIIHPARAKYLHIMLYKDDQLLWQNYQKDPKEDTQGYFHVDFVDQNNHLVAIPAFAYAKGEQNNITPQQTKQLRYKVADLDKANKVVIQYYVLLANPTCAASTDLKDPSLVTPTMVQEITFTLH